MLQRSGISSGPAKTLAHKSELDIVANFTLEFPDSETGGSLFGFWTHSGYPVIHYAIGPGPLARRSPSAFHQDGEFLRKVGRRLRQDFGAQHIGEWHSHYRLGLSEPSDHDERTIRNALRVHGLDRFLLIICNIVQQPKARMTENTASPLLVRPHAYLFTSADEHYSPCHWVVLDGVSPMRQASGCGWGQHHLLSSNMQAEWQVEPRTTLEEVPPQQAMLSRDHWIYQEEPKRIFTQVFKRLQSVLEEVRIMQNNDDSISLHGCQSEMHFELCFPADFPEQTPRLHSLVGRCERVGLKVRLQLHVRLWEIIRHANLELSKLKGAKDDDRLDRHPV